MVARRLQLDTRKIKEVGQFLLKAIQPFMRLVKDFNVSVKISAIAIGAFPPSLGIEFGPDEVDDTMAWGILEEVRERDVGRDDPDDDQHGHGQLAASARNRARLAWILQLTPMLTLSKMVASSAPSGRGGLPALWFAVLREALRMCWLDDGPPAGRAP